jgi:hypothetical protein
VSTGQESNGLVAWDGAFETRDFYPACFLPAGYDLIDLRDEGRRKVFIFGDRPARPDDVLAFYGEGAAVPALAFSAAIKGREGSPAQCLTNRARPTPGSLADRNSARHSSASFRSSLTGSVMVTSAARFRAALGGETGANSL